MPVHAFVEDVAASGGYWLACAADRIWVDPSSIVGSIGVISSSFGLQDFIARHGIERRVHTAGKSKSMLDPFRPEKPEDVARLKALAGADPRQLHRPCRRPGAAARLADDPEMFTGEIWVGQAAVEVGLADGVGHLVPKMKELYGGKVRFHGLWPAARADAAVRAGGGRGGDRRDGRAAGLRAVRALRCW